MENLLCKVEEAIGTRNDRSASTEPSNDAIGFPSLLAPKEGKWGSKFARGPLHLLYRA